MSYQPPGLSQLPQLPGGSGLSPLTGGSGLSPLPGGSGLSHRSGVGLSQLASGSGVQPTVDTTSQPSSQDSTSPVSTESNSIPAYYLRPRKRPRIPDDSSSSSILPLRSLLSRKDYIIKTGSDLTTFGLFKEWAEDTIFVFRENNNDDGEIVLSVDVKINFEGSTLDSLNWPGPFKECSNCKTSYEKSSFRNNLFQINWSNFKTQGVPNSISEQIKDLATCARSAAMYRFGDVAMKAYLDSIIQHTRCSYICSDHSEHIGICHPMQAADVGGVSLMVEALQKCPYVEADSSSGERSSSYEHNMYFLKGKPDVACIIELTRRVVVFSVEGKKESLIPSDLQLSSCKIGQLLFYLLCYCIEELKTGRPTNTGHLGIFVQGEKGILCWAKVEDPTTARPDFRDSKSINIRIATTGFNDGAGGGINLLSSNGLYNLTQYIYRFLQKGLDEA